VIYILIGVLIYLAIGIALGITGRILSGEGNWKVVLAMGVLWLPLLILDLLGILRRLD